MKEPEKSFLVGPDYFQHSFFVCSLMPIKERQKKNRHIFSCRKINGNCRYRYRLKINIPASIRLSGFITGKGQLVLILLVKHNTYLQTKIKNVLFNGIFFLKARKKLVAYLWSNFPIKFSR